MASPFSHDLTAYMQSFNTQHSIQEVVLSDAYIVPYFDNRFKMKEEDMPRKAEYCIGARYSLQGCECDDFSMPIKEYELKGILGTVNGIVLDSLVMKQISGPISTIFSLTKGDCKTLNIPFEKGLQIFPKNLNWVRVDETPQPKEVEFNPSNLSTYPVCIVDNTIRQMLVKLSGFQEIHTSTCKEIITPDGRHIPTLEFVTSLQVRFKKTIFGDNITSSHKPQNQCVGYTLATANVGVVNFEQQVVDNTGSIYLELHFKGPQAYSDNARTVDRQIGIAPSKLNGEFNEFFEVVWQEVKNKPIEHINLPKREVKIDNLTMDVHLSPYQNYKTIPTMEELERRWRSLGMKSRWAHSWSEIDESLDMFDI